MPHEFGIPHTDEDPSAPRPRRPSNASRRIRGANPVSRPQLPVSPANQVLSQQPRRSRNIVQAAAGAVGDFLSRRPGVGGTGRDIVHGQSRRPGDFRAGNPRLIEGFQNVAETAFPDLRNPPRGTPGTDEPDFFGEAPEGLPPRPGQQFPGAGVAVGRGLRAAGDVGGDLLRRGAASAVRGAGAIRSGASDFTSGVFEGLDLPTNLLEGTVFNPLDQRTAGGLAREAVVGRPGAEEGPPPDFAADDGLTPQERLDLTKFGSGTPANLTNEEGAPTAQQQADFFRSQGQTVEEIGNEVARPGTADHRHPGEVDDGRTTAIRGTNVSQTRGGQDGGGDFPDAVFDEGFEVPAGTTDAELRDPERLKVLQARNSLSQSLRQVPAPGEAGIPAEAQSKMLADFDTQAAAERGATTRNREQLASLERRAAFTASIATRLGLPGGRGAGKRFTVVAVPRGDGAGGSLGSEAVVVDNFTGAQQRIDINRSRAERDTEFNRKELEANLRDVNPGMTDAQIAKIFRFWVDNDGRFPPGLDFNSGNSGGFLDNLF